MFVLAILIVFDFTKIETLHHCRSWLSEVLKVSSSQCPFIFLVGTKLDMMVIKQYEFTKKYNFQIY